MSQHLGQSGSTTYLRLDDVAAVLAASPGPKTAAVWSRSPTDAIATRFILSVATTAAANAAVALYWYAAGSQDAWTCAAGGMGGSIATASSPGDVWRLYVLRFTTAVGITAYDGVVRGSINGGTFGSALSCFGTSVAINNLTLGARRWNSAAADSICANRKFSYFGLWDGLMSQGNATLLATQAPKLVDPSNQIFITDKNLSRVAGESTEFAVTGSDIEVSSDNPQVLTSLDSSALLLGVG